MSEFLRKYRVYILACLVSIIVGSLGAVVWARFAVHREQAPPDYFDVKTYTDSKFPDFGLSAYSGSDKLDTYLAKRKVLLVIVSTSCGGCKYEIELLKSTNFLKDSGIEVAFVGFEKDQIIADFVKENGLDIPIFDDRRSTIKDRFDLKVTPVNFVIVNGELKRGWNGSPSSIDDLLTKVGLPSQLQN